MHGRGIVGVLDVGLVDAPGKGVERLQQVADLARVRTEGEDLAI